MAETAEDTGSKIVVTVTALAAGLLAQQAVKLTWRAVRGQAPTKDDDDTPLVEILLFAAVSAATVSAARTWATHKASRRTAASQGLD
jgi:hypothetical protein